MCHYLPHSHKNTCGESLTSLCFAKLTKNRFLTALTASLTLCMSHHDFKWHTACCSAHVFWVKNKRKKEKDFKKSAPFTLPHPTDTEEPRADDLDSNWLNTRKGKLQADKASSKGTSLRLTVFWYFNPDLQSILNLLFSLSTIVRDLSIKN